MGIKFLRKNRMDVDTPNVTITITDAVASDNGQDYVNFLRDRKNTSGWATTGSTDAALTELEVDLFEEYTFDHIILTKHNFKSYTIQYWNGATYVDFSTAINETTNTLETTSHVFNSVSSSKIKLIVNGTFVVDDQKFMTQLIITELIGELTAQPEIKPKISKSKKVNSYLSGKGHIIRTIESSYIKIKKDNIILEADLALQETLVESFEGFLVWLCGGTVSQYDTIRKGYRLEDIPLMNCRNELEPEWGQSRYKNGMTFELDLIEVNE